MSLTVVFDTNILLSGIGWGGKPYQCLELAREGFIGGVICQEILDEFIEKLEIKLKFSANQITDTIADLMSFLRLVKISNSLKFLADDPADDKVLECALIANADYIITGDRRHLLPLGNYKGIKIYTASDFIKLVNE
ncbi:TPA: putative toxin-antitoxin system toxin component, PIN family [bacterium]|nr:putative toxin-antitoxin system toxin component, PIN family [bacterium]